ncbi:MAG: Trm112 family protein [Calditrichia bacterium]
MLDQQLLEILACPQCKGDLEYNIDAKNDKNGELICHTCKLKFKVEDDIPIMLLDEAEKLED